MRHFGFGNAHVSSFFGKRERSEGNFGQKWVFEYGAFRGQSTVMIAQVSSERTQILKGNLKSKVPRALERGQTVRRRDVVFQVPVRLDSWCSQMTMNRIFCGVICRQISTSASSRPLPLFSVRGRKFVKIVDRAYKGTCCVAAIILDQCVFLI